jgi:hypothetical protein
MLQRMSPLLAHSDGSHLGGRPSLSEQSGHGWTCCWLGSVANDPQRHFSTVNCRIAKRASGLMLKALEAWANVMPIIREV